MSTGAINSLRICVEKSLSKADKKFLIETFSTGGGSKSTSGAMSVTHGVRSGLSNSSGPKTVGLSVTNNIVPYSVPYSQPTNTQNSFTPESISNAQTIINTISAKYGTAYANNLVNVLGFNTFANMPKPIYIMDLLTAVGRNSLVGGAISQDGKYLSASAVDNNNKLRNYKIPFVSTVSTSTGQQGEEKISGFGTVFFPAPAVSYTTDTATNVQPPAVSAPSSEQSAANTRPVAPYNFDKTLSQSELDEYKKKHTDVFGELNIWDEENTATLVNLVKEGKTVNEMADIFGTGGDTIRRKIKELNLQIKENFEPKIKRTAWFSRLRYYVDNKIITLHDPKLNLVDSIINRKFHVGKLTISFGDPSKAMRTDLKTLENMRGENNEPIKIDPIEYEIRKMDPRDAIKKVIKERLEPFVNMIFEFLDYDSKIPGVIRIGFDNDAGTWSLIGINNVFTQDEFTMNFSWLDAGTIMHEMCHALGMIHEHQVPEGHQIQWNEPVVYAWAKKTYDWDKETTYTNILKKYEKSRLNVINFDKNSIMLYFFPAELTMDRKGCHQNLRMSIEDVKFLMSIIPGKNTNIERMYNTIYPSPSLLRGLRDLRDLGSMPSYFVYFYIFCIFVFFVVVIYLRFGRSRLNFGKPPLAIRETAASKGPGPG